jgi:hypothetical protein
MHVLHHSFMAVICAAENKYQFEIGEENEKQQNTIIY